MAERATVSKFLYRRPWTTNSERETLNDHGNKAEILKVRLVLKHVLKTPGLGQQKKKVEVT